MKNFIKEMFLLGILLFLNTVIFSQREINYSELETVLEKVFDDDQNPRNYAADSIASKYGFNSEQERHYARTVILKNDSINRIKITKILNTYGWIHKDSISKKASLGLYLPIQHGSLEFQEKLLPILKKALTQGKVSSILVAYTEDRIASRKKELQTYGTQVGMDEKTQQPIVLPVKDPANLNKRRASIGLNNIEEYVKKYNIEWTVDKQIKINKTYEKQN